MTIHPFDDATAAAADPLAGFSQCHAGILGGLDALCELPALLEPATRARRIAAATIRLFRDAVVEHHAEEERELFTAVLDSARRGAEHEVVQVIVERLTSEHRLIEAMWSRLEPALKAVAKGHDVDLDASALQRLVDAYREHADYEERQFLPLSQAILGRDGNHLAALGMSLHMRRAEPALLERARAHW